jgi:PAS domain S-box-containing protein
MKEGHKTKEQLINELAEARRRIAELEASEAERKQAEEELQKSQKELQTLMDASPVAISWADLEGNILYKNRKHHELFGYTLEDIPTVAEWQRQADQDPAQRERFDRWMKETKEAHKHGRSLPPPQEMTVTCKDGSIRYVTVEVTVASNRTLAIYNDITERKRAEEALQESEENFRALADNANDGFLIAAGKGEHVYANRRMAEILGYSVPELLKTTMADLVHPDQLKEVMERFQKRLEGKPVPRQYEAVFVRKDGQSIPLELASAKTVWRGQPATIVTLRDVTERKRAQETLQESERRFRTLAEATFEGIALSEKGVYVDLNDQLARMLGYARNELIGKPLLETVAPESRELVAEAVRSGRIEPYEHFARRKDGTTFPVEVRAGITQIANRQLRVTVIRDITERKRAEEGATKSPR